MRDIGAACGAPVFYGEDRRRRLDKASLGVGRALRDRSVAAECGGPREICRLRGRLWRRQSAQERTVHGLFVPLSTLFRPCPAVAVGIVSQLVMHDPSSCRKILGWKMGELYTGGGQCQRERGNTDRATASSSHRQAGWLTSHPLTIAGGMSNFLTRCSESFHPSPTRSIILRG